jgi:signal transduction histidine kinase/ligand-binding sensor domain-containing protein
MSPSKPALALITLLEALSALFWSPALGAPDPSPDIIQYAHNAWTFRSGFLNGAVYTIAQTPDGYLWLGTQSGVVRFDGVRALPLSLPAGQQLPSTAVGSLLSARDGTLWIGTLGGLASWNNGGLTEFSALAHQSVIALLEGRDGTVWAGGFGSPTGKLCAIRDRKATCYGEDGSLGPVVASLYEDAEGSLWVGAGTGLWRWNPGPPTHSLSIPIASMHALTQGDHAAGVAVAAGSIYQIVGEKELASYPLPGAPSPLTAQSVLRDRHGGLWIGTRAHGLVHSSEGKTFLFTQTDGLTADVIVALFEDREGTIWVATPNGLDQFRESPVGSLSVNAGLSSATTTSILAARDGSIWIGTADGLDQWKDGRMTIYRARSSPGLPGDSIQSLFEDEAGRIWVSGFTGLAVFDHGEFTAVPAVPAGLVHAIESDNRSGLWLSMWLTADDYGLVHLVGRKIVEEAPWRNFSGGPGAGLVPDLDGGGVWTGLFSGGLAYFRQGPIRNLPLRDDTGRAGRVLDLSRDRDSSLWAATESGLSRIKNGRVVTLTTANGLPCNAVHWIIEDDQSSYWLYTRCGLLRIPRTELDAWAADPQRSVRPMIFDAADGIHQIATNKGFRPAVTKAPDGRIWFLNGDTVSVVDPSRVAVNTLPPQVHIEEFAVDHKSYDAKSGQRLPPLVRDLSINYTALSLVAPEKVHFKYKLEGQDPDWREVVNDRKAEYSNLAPGNYRFRVIASNNSGVWNETGASLDFSIAPAYWQTGWFRALCVAAMLALLWVLYRLRMRQLAHEFDMKVEARVDERTRIARDLHDTLLQSFNGLLLRFRTVHALFSKSPDEARTILENALDETRQALTEGRQAVQGLRTSTVETHEFSDAIKTLAEELTSDQTHSGGAEVRLNVEGTPRSLRPLIRDEVYRIASEALRNAFRHAEARRIELQLSYDEKGFELRVRDDGKGIDPKFLTDKEPAGHFGLRGMRERAEQIGGKLTVWSAPASGTELVLSVSGAIAYDTAEKAKRSWLARSLTARPRTPQS